MAAEVLPLQPLKTTPGPSPLTPEQIYWQSFKNQLLLPSPHNAAVTSITTPSYLQAQHASSSLALSSTFQDAFVVTSGGRVQIYSSKTRKLLKTISRFGVDDVARSGVLRRDGRVLAAAGDSGVIQCFDVGSRAVLKTWRPEKGQAQSVQAVRWSPHLLTDLMTAGDDATVKLWDLTADEPSTIFTGHTDYVRCANYLPEQVGIVVSGSYDSTVRLWDSRTPGRSSMTFKHTAPIEDVLPLSSSSLAAASGNEVSILNLTAGRVETILKSHQKTVTSLSSAQNGSRLVTGALDGHVKIHNVSSWLVVHGQKYPSPILSLSVVPTARGEDIHLAVGLQSGLLSLRTRLSGQAKARGREKARFDAALIAGDADEFERKQRKKSKRQGDRIRDRGNDFRGEGADIIITGNDRPRTKKLKGWQEQLRKGKYARSLDSVLGSRDANDILTLLTALRHRSALRTALADRNNDEQLIPVFSWLLKSLGHPRHLSITTDVLLLLLDLYSHRIPLWQDGESEDGRDLAKLMNRIGKRVRIGAELAQQAESTLGMVELLAAGG